MTAGARVLVTPRSLTAAGLDAVEDLEPLRSHGYELVGPAPGTMPTKDELLALLPGCVGWLAGIEPIDQALFSQAPDLKVISRNGAGTDAIDLEAAERAGVRVERAAGANAQGVAELVLTLVLCSLRQVLPTATALRRGEWARVKGSEIAERRIGIVGLGAVGTRTAAAFTALGADVVGHDPYTDEARVPLVTLDELLTTTDVISLSCPPSPDGRAIVDANRLALVGEGTILVNTARAALVDDDAVLAAIDDGRLTTYAVDAFDTEPPQPSKLLRHERVIATPHLGGYTTSSIQRATRAAVDNLLAALETT